MLFCQFTPKRLTHVIHIPAVQFTGGIGEVNILEDTEGLARQAYPSPQNFLTHPLLINCNKFPWLNFAHKVGSDTVQGTRFRGNNPAFADTSEAEGTHSPGVAHGIEPATRQDHEAVGSHQQRKDGDHAFP